MSKRIYVTLWRTRVEYLWGKGSWIVAKHKAELCLRTGRISPIELESRITQKLLRLSYRHWRRLITNRTQLITNTEIVKQNNNFHQKNFSVRRMRSPSLPPIDKTITRWVICITMNCHKTLSTEIVQKFRLIWNRVIVSACSRIRCRGWMPLIYRSNRKPSRSNFSIDCGEHLRGHLVLTLLNTMRLLPFYLRIA